MSRANRRASERRRQDPVEFLWASPLGLLRLSGSAAGLRRLEFAGRTRGSGAAEAPRGPARRWAKALENYFAGRPPAIGSGDLDWAGASAFQTRVWRALLDLRWGETASYAELARRIGAPGAARAVGRAVAANPVPILVPCHRVVRSDGLLGGYSFGLDCKDRLLEHEGVAVARGPGGPRAAARGSG